MSREEFGFTINMLVGVLSELGAMAAAIWQWGLVDPMFELVLVVGL